MSKTLKIIISLIMAAVLGVAAYFIITTQIRNSKHVDRSEFETMLESGEFSSIDIDGYTLTGHLKGSKDYLSLINI